MADCAYTFTGPDGKPLTIVGVPGLKAYLVDGGLEHLFPERKFPLKAVARFSRGETTQEDIFKGDFATKRTTVSRTEVISSKGDTVTVKKPNIDSQGRQISTTKSGLERFWDFYKNGPVDDAGKPILLYHSTNSDIAVFEKGRVTTNNFGLLGDVETSRAGVFATPDLSFSQDYLREGEGQNIMPVFMALQNPLDLRAGLSESDELALEAAGVNVRMIYQTQNDWELFDNDEEGKNDFVSALEKAGYDGAIISEEGQDGKQHDTYVAFRNTQIKSAIGNQGSFSPEDADIRYSTTEKPTRKNTFQNQAAAEEHLLQSFGPGIKNLITSKVLNFTQGKDSWPEKVQRQLRGGEEAVYVNGKAYIDLQAISKDRLNAVVLHEIGEHFNLKLILGPEGYKSLQDQITNRAKIKGSQAEKIWNQVERLYPDLEVGSEAFVSEVIAKLGEANPQAPWYRRLLTRIKAFLVERGLGRGFITGTMTEDDMHDLLRTSLMSAAGRFAQGEARVYGEGVMASVPRPEILTLLEEFANDDEVFKHPISDKKSIEDIMAEVAPAYSFDERRSDLVSTDKVKTSVFVTPRKRLIFINESDGKVWLNVSKMKPGDAGGAIYAAVGNYAYNNGLKFIDDPAGLSAASVKRRPVHMLSLALKFGTTDFMDVSEDFDALSKQIGLPELNWKNDYDSDLSSLILRNVFYVYNALPELHRINYDFKTDRFRDVSGRIMRDIWAKRISGGEAARSNSIGDSTIRRAVFLKSLASATSEEKSRLLENYRANGGLAGRVSLKGIFSRPIENLQPAPEERTSLWNRWFGKSKMQRGGEPIKFYHGSQAEFTVFDKSRLATNTTHTTAGLGHFFTMRKGEAESYGGNVKEVFLSVQKPYVTFSWDLNAKFSDAQGAAKFREKLQAEGYDGVYIKDAGYAVTFESNQAKLTENQSPTFGEDVRFSRVEKQPWEMTSEEYETPTDLKPQQSFYVNAGGRTRIEIIRNPSSSDLNALKKEAIADYGEPAPGDPSLRFTADAEGNKYYWKAAEGVHAIVEPAISRLEGVQVNQNADYRPSHRMVVRRALYNGESIPTNVLAEYPGLEDEVHEIPGNKVAGAARFSRIDDADTIQESAKDLGAQLKEKFRKMSSGLMAQRFAFLSVRQMVEQAKDYLTNVPEYEYNMQERRAEVDRWLIKGDRVVSEYWKKLSKASRKALSDVIHNSTLSDVDASKAWSGMEELKGDKGQATGIIRVYTQAQLSNENQKWLDSLVRDNGGTIAAASGRGYVDIMKVNWDKAEGVLAELQARELAQAKTRAANRWKDENPARKQSHAKLQSDFNALPDQAKFVYSEANKLHNEMFTARMKALEAQINDAILDVATRTKLNKELRQRMESQSLAWYYAPLSRHGNHWFYGVDDKGTKWFRTFEHEKGRDEAMKQFLSENQIRGEILGSGTSISEKKGTLGSEVSDSFIREINEAISRNVPSEEGVKLQDAIYQMYIDTLPDVSVRHSAMHRKGVLGFDEDAMRSFSHAIHHGASQLSNMIYGRKMEDVLNEAEEGLEVASSSNQRGLREAEIEAIKYLQDDWETLSEEGYIESQLRKFIDGEGDEDAVDGKYADVSEDVWAKMKAMRNKFGRLDEDARDEAFERHVDKINRVLDIASHIKHEDKSKAAAVISELRKTYKAMVATGSSDMDQVAAYIRQGNFIWTLGFSFSGGMINMLQTPVVAMPIAYGKYGMSKTVAEFNRSRNEFIKAATEGLKRDKKGNFLNRDDDGNVSISVGIERKLENTAYGTPEHELLRDELEAISLFKESGDISRTQTFELIGVGQQGEEHGGKLQDFAKWAGWGFHFGERANREITLMATYRLARSTGASHDEAIAAARQLNNTAHGDYSSENAARIFRGWPAQIALQYKKYVQMQLYLWGSTAMNAIRLINDRSSKEGREAARTLGGLFVMQSAFAGMMGLPLMGMASAIINAIGGIFDDEDEPFNVEEEIRVWLAQNFGETWATAVMKGGLNALTPVNIGDRLSLRDVVFRDPMVELEGRDAATNMLASLFGPTGGTIQRLYESGKLLNDGEVLRAAENATPKFISDVFKAGRYFSEDARSLNHQMLKEMTTMENLFQLAGFSSSALEVKYAERGMTKKREANIGEYRKKLINDAVRAEEEGEYFDWSVIEDFNEKYPTKAIVPDSIRKSIDRREDYAERSEDRGYAIDPKLEFLYEEYDLDESE